MIRRLHAVCMKTAYRLERRCCAGQSRMAGYRSGDFNSRDLGLCLQGAITASMASGLRFPESAGDPHAARLVLSGQPTENFRALPARITNRVGRFRPTPGAANVYCAAGVYTFPGHGPVALDHGGLDLSPSMLAPCSLGCPGTPRQHAVSAARRGYGQPHRTAGPGSYWHRSVPAQ
jgi:hypothetical protein